MDTGPSAETLALLRATFGDLAETLGAEILDLDDAAPSDHVVDWSGEPVFALRLPHLHEALNRLIQGVEKEIGAPLAELDRQNKQRAVALLAERGAFTLRKSVEHVAEALGVSRFTVYNYLERSEQA